MTPVTRFVGTCPVCQREFKVTPLTRRGGHAMVLHGYQRPGIGYLLGDCFGHRKLPYELSDSGCVSYREAVKNQKASAEALIVHLRSGEAKKAFVQKRSFGRTEIVEVLAGEKNFEEALKIYLNSKISEVKSCEYEIARMEKLIAAWTLKDLRTEEDVVRVSDGKAAERKAERDAKRAVRFAKAAAQKALVAKRAEERAALIAEYKDLFERTAASPENTNSKRHFAVETWVKMYKRMDKKAYLHFYPRELGCDDALIAIDLAYKKTTHVTFIVYADRQGIPQ